MNLTLVAVVAIALFFDFTNGFHDTANSIATSVSTRALSPRVAVLSAAVLNFAGAFVSVAVAATIAKGIVDQDAITLEVVMAGLVGAITWNLVTWLIGLPSSSSHALIGGMIGSAIAASGWGVVNWERDQGQRADPVAHRAVPRRRVRLPAHSRDHLARRPAGADEGEPRLPQGPARVGGVRGVHARDERRTEDDGHHRPGTGHVGSPRPELRAPTHVGDRRLGDRDGRGDVRRGLAHHQDARNSASRRSTRRRGSRRRRRARRSSGGRRTSASPCRRRTPSPDRCSVPAQFAASTRCGGASPGTSSSRGS